MDETWFIPLWLQLAVVAVFVAVVVTFILPMIVQHMHGSGGWSGLAKCFAVTPRKFDSALQRQTLKVGHVLWRNCVTVGMLEDGLYLEIKTPLPFLTKPPLLIPWSEIIRGEPVRQFWQQAHQLNIGNPMIATITLSGDLYHRVAARLQTGDSANRGRQRLWS